MNCYFVAPFFKVSTKERKKVVLQDDTALGSQTEIVDEVRASEREGEMEMFYSKINIGHDLLQRGHYVFSHLHFSWPTCTPQSRPVTGWILASINIGDVFIIRWRHEDSASLLIRLQRKRNCTWKEEYMPSGPVDKVCFFQLVYIF